MLGRAISAYGSEAFDRRTLATFKDSDSAYEAERFVVDKDFVERKDTYNIKLGGHGGGCEAVVESNKRRRGEKRPSQSEAMKGNQHVTGKKIEVDPIYHIRKHI